MARILPALAAAALIVAGFAAVVIFFGARDESGIEQPVVQRDGASGDPLLAAGNVRIEYRDADQAAAVRELAAELGATDGEAARRAGQAVIVRRVPGLESGVAVSAASDRLTAATASDPAVAAFVRQHLGRAE